MSGVNVLVAATACIPDEAPCVPALAALLGARVGRVPYRLMRVAVAIAWHLRIKGIGEAPRPTLHFFRRFPLTANEKIKREARFRFHHMAEQALHALARSRRER